MYEDKWSGSASKFYKRLTAGERRRVDATVKRICKDPVRAAGTRPLRGELRGLWRNRFGDFRIIYSIDPPSNILVVRVLDRRKDVYR